MHPFRCCFALAALAVLPLCRAQQTPYKDTSAPLERRVDDLISRMSLEEKVSQLMNDSPAIERPGVPAYNCWNERLLGVARGGRATVFPETIGLAATWDSGLALRVATAISDEARVKYHEFVRRNKRNIYQGLTFWTPNINLLRDPRCRELHSRAAAGEVRIFPASFHAAAGRRPQAPEDHGTPDGVLTANLHVIGSSQEVK